MFKKYLYYSIDHDLMAFIFDHDLEQMTLAKYKKAQTCSDWRSIEILSFLLFWPWPVTLVLNHDLDIMMTYFHNHNKVSRSIGLKVIS